MKVLVLNCGSSSLKCQLIDMENEERIMKGHYDRIGGNRSSLRFNVRGNKTVIEHPARDFEEAISEILNLLISPEYSVIKSFDEIDAVGHRIVHGGEKFKESVIIDDEVIKAIEDCITLAPLHNPAGLAGIKACQKLLPHAPMVAVFDTSFHQTMEEKAYIYNLPYKYYEDYKIRKYGFHGISHRYIAKRISEIVGREDIKVINCHLGQRSFTLCYKKWKISRYNNGINSTSWCSNGNKMWRCRPINNTNSYEIIRYKAR
jgi:acetate kinase